MVELEHTDTSARHNETVIYNTLQEDTVVGEVSEDKKSFTLLMIVEKKLVRTPNVTAGISNLTHSFNMERGGVQNNSQSSIPLSNNDVITANTSDSILLPLEPGQLRQLTYSELSRD